MEKSSKMLPSVVAVSDGGVGERGKGGREIRKTTAPVEMSSSPKRNTKRPLQPSPPVAGSPRVNMYINRKTSSTSSSALSSSVSFPDEAISRLETEIPREFFVVETNAVLPVTQYPVDKFLSNFNGSKWETIVFPSLQPHTRREVLHLRSTLLQMLEQLKKRQTAAVQKPKRYKEDNEEEEIEVSVSEMIGYTANEYRIYSICFRELIRQMRFVCKEQSELLDEVRVHYDTALKRFLEYFQSLDSQLREQTDQIQRLLAEQEETRLANDQLIEQALNSARVVEIPQTSSGANHCACCSLNVASTKEKKESDDLEEDELLVLERERRYRYEHRRRRDLGIMREVEESCVDERNEQDEQDKKQKPQQQERTGASVETRDALAEKNLAAARLQTTFRKFQVRIVQHRQAVKVQQASAACEIQRQYRGFSHRRKYVHKRAIHQAIMLRRKQQAAVELLQSNVRMYLAKKKKEQVQKQRRSSLEKLMQDDFSLQQQQEETKRQRKSENLELMLEKLKAFGEEFTSMRGPAAHKLENETKEKEDVAIAHRGQQQNDTKARHLPQKKVQEVVSIMEEALQVLKGFEEPPALMAAESNHEDLNSSDTAAAGTSTITALGQPQADRSDSPKGELQVKIELNSQEISKIEEHLSQETAGQATISFGAFDHSTSIPESEADEGNSQQSVISTFHLAPFKDPVARIAAVSSSSSEKRYSVSVSSIFKTSEEGEEVVLDDFLWRPSVYPLQNTFVSNPSRRASVESIAASRRVQDVKKKTSLKRFISEMYQVAVTKFIEHLSRRKNQLEDFIRYKCSLALSIDEWKELHTITSLEVVEKESFSLLEIVKDYFQRKFGLRSLVESALDDLAVTLEEMARSDPDIKLFHDFIYGIRPEQEYHFFCICRYLASPSSTGLSCLLFSTDTLREIIPVSDALRIARRLFRIEEEAQIIEKDGLLVETDNAMYKRYLPSSGFNQIEAITMRMSALLQSSSCESPARSTVATVSFSASSPSLAISSSDALSRKKSFVKSQSGLVTKKSERNFRRLSNKADASMETPPTASLPPPASGVTTSSSTDSIHFSELVDLLLKYRSEMNHFHLLVKWVQDLWNRILFEQERQQRSRNVVMMEESFFVENVLCYSQGPTDRELRNLFQNALKVRHLSHLMPSRVFLSVVLLLLRNGLLSVVCYRPLFENPKASEEEKHEEREWMLLARLWRAKEADFDTSIDQMFSDRAGEEPKALRLLALRSELYKLLVARDGKENRRRAEAILHSILQAMSSEAGSEDVIKSLMSNNNDPKDVVDSNEETREKIYVDFERQSSVKKALREDVEEDVEEEKKEEHREKEEDEQDAWVEEQSLVNNTSVADLFFPLGSVPTTQ